MEKPYLPYLELLDSLRGELDRLSSLSQEKITAVRKDDLAALDQVLKQEQVISLSLRGLEQKRTKLLTQLGLENTKLTQLSEHYPPELKLQAKQTAEELLRQYKIYQSAAEVARSTLECNLHEVEKALAEMDGGVGGGPGYAPNEVDIPPSMKTDFRA